MFLQEDFDEDGERINEDDLEDALSDDEVLADESEQENEEEGEGVTQTWKTTRVTERKKRQDTLRGKVKVERMKKKRPKYYPQFDTRKIAAL
jgi:hypothetical protein